MNTLAILYAVGVFLIVILLLVTILLVAKKYLVSSGNVKVTINGDKVYDVAAGGSLLNQLGEAGVHLPSACGGKGSCGQCKCQVLSGGGEILPTETVHFSRKQQKEGWRLGCQVKVKEDITMKVDEAVLGVKEWECEVISNKNVATFIKEFKVQLPPGEHMHFEPGSYAQIIIPEYDIDYDRGEHMHFEPGSYAQIIIPEYDIDYDRDMDKSLIGDLYLPAWQKFGLFKLKQKNTQATVRAYSMANYPDEGDIITLTVRIATPPFKPKEQCPNGPEFMDVPCGIASTYIFSLKPGDKVRMSGPYGEFRPVYDSKKEMIWVGGGAGMAPLRAQIMHMLKTRNCRDRRPDPKADQLGIKYTPGFIAPVMGDTYLKQHDAPEDIEYYLCGPPMMAKTVLDLLHSLGVDDADIRFDNFGG